MQDPLPLQYCSSTLRWVWDAGSLWEVYKNIYEKIVESLRRSFEPSFVNETPQKWFSFFIPSCLNRSSVRIFSVFPSCRAQSEGSESPEIYVKQSRVCTVQVFYEIDLFFKTVCTRESQLHKLRRLRIIRVYNSWILTRDLTTGLSPGERYFWQDCRSVNEFRDMWHHPMELPRGEWNWIHVQPNCI